MSSKTWATARMKQILTNPSMMDLILYFKINVEVLNWANTYAQ